MRAVHPAAIGGDLTLGPRLRAARERQGLTLAQVAEASSLTKGFISRVERDQTSPSVDSLVRLCQVLSLPMGELFAEPEVAHTRLQDAPLINMGGTGTLERLVSARQEARVQVIHSTLEPGASGGESHYTVNCEVEVVHVTAGSLTLHFPLGDVNCGQGDSVTFPGREPHTWTAGEDGASVVWVLVPAAWSGSR
ncbi:helix-turn-helix domain-containing protein [Actinomycetota bacterium]